MGQRRGDGSLFRADAVLTPSPSFAALRAAFAWQLPERYNIGVDACDKWAQADPSRLAIIDVAADGRARHHDFAALRAASNRLANVLALHGIGRPGAAATGDRVGVLLAQRFETAAAHLGILKAGAVSLPLFTLFGPDALRHRLVDSGARAVVTDTAGATAIAGIRSDLPALELVLSIGGAVPGALDFDAACAAASPEFTPADTHPDDPAILIYTSGTTGKPKGALHGHRVLLGHLPGVEVSHDFLPHPGDRFWTPADWAWIGGLLDVLLPALHHGIPVVARRFEKFTAEGAFALMREQGVRNVFLPPTALKMMRRAPSELARGLSLRSVASGGEPLGEALLAWGRDVLGVTINEFYGQTECNMIVSACGAVEPPVPGTMGRPVPGHEVAVLDATSGTRRPAGVDGEIAVRAPDPVMFLGYWRAPEATLAKFVDGPDGRWMLTGDRGVEDGSGRLRFIARGDDVITSGGYRIGPAEVEDCLLGHPAVRLAGVVGKPDPLRGTVVAAYVQLHEGSAPSPSLADEIALHVKTRLAANQYPRVVRFVEDMPMTVTGKIIRAHLRQLAEAEAAAEEREKP